MGGAARLRYCWSREHSLSTLWMLRPLRVSVHAPLFRDRWNIALAVLTDQILEESVVAAHHLVNPLHADHLQRLGFMFATPAPLLPRYDGTNLIMPSHDRSDLPRVSHGQLLLSDPTAAPLFLYVLMTSRYCEQIATTTLLATYQCK